MNHNLHIRFALEPVKWVLGATLDVAVGVAIYEPLADASGNIIIDDPGRQILLQNGTDGDVMISIDGVNAHAPLFKGSFILLDIAANKEGPSDMFDMSKGTTVYAIQLNAAYYDSIGMTGPFAGLYTVPTTGAIFSSLVYAQ